jgi:hypothetical protein
MVAATIAARRGPSSAASLAATGLMGHFRHALAGAPSPGSRSPPACDVPDTIACRPGRSVPRPFAPHLPLAAASTSVSTTTRNPAEVRRNSDSLARHLSSVLWMAPGRAPAPNIYCIVLIGTRAPYRLSGWFAATSARHGPRGRELRGKSVIAMTACSHPFSRRQRPCLCLSAAARGASDRSAAMEEVADVSNARPRRPCPPGR